MKLIIRATEAIEALDTDLEGRAEVYEDDGDSRAGAIDAALAWLRESVTGAGEYEVPVTVAYEVAASVENVLDIGVDSLTDIAPDKAADALAIEGAELPLACAEAIAGAIEYLDLAHGHDDNTPPEIAAIIATLQAILDQRGCEGNSVWGEGYPDEERASRLTSVMDCVIFG